MAILLDEVNTITQKTIMPGVVDNFFKAGPMTAYLKSRFTRKWVGPQIQENYLFRPMKGGSYRKGGTFDTTKITPYTGLLFNPRYYFANVTQYLEELEVEYAGPQVVFNKVKTDMETAAMTLSSILEIAFFHDGQNIGASDRTADINGLAEALSDGSNASWTGRTYTTYGGQTRADVSPALNSPAGLIAANVNGGINFRTLEHSYQSCVIGAESPKIGITTTRGMGYIAEAFAPQQKVDTMDPEINWPGFKFNRATIVQSNYCPGEEGVNDPDLGNYYTGAAAGETFWWLNPGPQGDNAYLRLYIAQSPKFAFGFTGFKGARGDNEVSGQILFAGNLTCRSPRLSRALYGIKK
jgi:hypothetical protein